MRRHMCWKPNELSAWVVFQQGLSIFGNGFLSKFEAASCDNSLLAEVTLVDTPGVLSGEKQRIERTYNFIDVCSWFATRCDLILLMFDPHKLDISDEYKAVRCSPLAATPSPACTNPLRGTPQHTCRASLPFAKPVTHNPTCPRSSS